MPQEPLGSSFFIRDSFSSPVCEFAKDCGATFGGRPLFLLTSGAGGVVVVDATGTTWFSLSVVEHLRLAGVLGSHSDSEPSLSEQISFFFSLIRPDLRVGSRGSFSILGFFRDRRGSSNLSSSSSSSALSTSDSER